MRRFCLLAISLTLICGSVVAQEPQSAGDYLNRGIARFNKRDYDGAIADFTKAITLSPKFSKTYALRGLAELRLGQDQQAEQDFNKALELSPTLKPVIDKGASDIKQKRNAAPKP